MMSSRPVMSVPSPSSDGGGRWPTARHPETALVLLPAGHRVATRTTSGHGALMPVITGTGTLTTRDGLRGLSPGMLLWLPQGSVRGVVAGTWGLAYLTVHR